MKTSRDQMENFGYRYNMIGLVNLWVWFKQAVGAQQKADLARMQERIRSVRGERETRETKVCTPAKSR